MELLGSVWTTIPAFEAIPAALVRAILAKLLVQLDLVFLVDHDDLLAVLLLVVGAHQLGLVLDSCRLNYLQSLISVPGRCHFLLGLN